MLRVTQQIYVFYRWLHQPSANVEIYESTQNSWNLSKYGVAHWHNLKNNFFLKKKHAKKSVPKEYKAAQKRQKWV